MTQIDPNPVREKVCMMKVKHTATETLDRNFLELRHWLIDIAAGFDRMDRGGEPRTLATDPRMKQLIAATQILVGGKSDRAERIQMIFSDQYDAEWRNA